MGTQLPVFTRRLRFNIIVATTILAFTLIFLLTVGSNRTQIYDTFSAGRQGHNGKAGVENNELSERLHVLLPATQGDVDLCKTLLTAKILGYPTPGLIAWDEEYNHPNQMAGGSHLAKVFRTLDYLESLQPAQDSDLVMMMDAYDIWFQLPPEVLIHRFHTINQAANARIQQQLGPATMDHGIEQKLIFGAGKRCAPNQLHSVACYPIPKSPLPDDLYGGNTDTVIGRNKYTSHRQRYLNSGYLMGTVGDVRTLLRAAAEEIKNTPDHVELDNGSGGSDFLYHGSDQSIFNTLFGRQEYLRAYLAQENSHEGQSSLGSPGGSRLSARDAIRRSTFGAQGRQSSKRTTSKTSLEGIEIMDPLNPTFTHEIIEAATDAEMQQWELGIGLDYFSDLGHQTVNSEHDVKWLTFADEPLDLGFPGKNKFDCPPRVDKDSALADITNSTTPFAGASNEAGARWEQLPLYTNLCIGKVPVMVHHNGDKGARGYRWPDMWFHGKLEAMLHRQLEAENAQTNRKSSNVIAWTDKGAELSWNDLCGVYEPSIYE
ncbi:hypothetical protein OHC33_010011 [Knufia fluminis]|uniref:Uncharacterized protein n=1 Tax=Knufia fluminis TaxID=191047 RepID=A0AAN8EA17_9EURO|nr:hypothetical protein OHC33_010011 [Knufia fluminis]